jgi:hypothetical protein
VCLGLALAFRSLLGLTALRIRQPSLTDPASDQVAKKIAKAILPDDLDERLQHKPWHGKQPTTLAAVTLYITTNLGSRVMIPGLPARTAAEVSEVCGVTAQTIEATYAELYDELRSFIPENLKPPMTEKEWNSFPGPNLKLLAKRDG